MSKLQFWILNSVGGVCALLILSNVFIVHYNERLRRPLVNAQNQIARAQQIQNTTENLALRVARSAQAEPVLRDLLTRHGFRVNLPADEKKGTAP